MAFVRSNYYIVVQNNITKQVDQKTFSIYNESMFIDLFNNIKKFSKQELSKKLENRIIFTNYKHKKASHNIILISRKNGKNIKNRSFSIYLYEYSSLEISQEIKEYILGGKNNE